MSVAKQYLGIVCANIVGTTQLYQQLGNTSAGEVVSRTLDILFDVIHKENGRVSETVGDELLATFGDIEHAARAACAMQRTVAAEHRRRDYADIIALRAGVEFGQVAITNEGIEGKIVDAACELARRAGPRQILMTNGSAEQMSGALRAQTRSIESPMPANQRRQAVVALEWHEGESVDASASAEGERLSLVHRSTQIELTASRPAAVLGRSPICDIKTDEALASRQHVRVERRDNRYYVIDQSTNGTYLRTADGQQVCLSGQAYPIEGVLEMSLGRAFSDNPEDTVRIEPHPPD